MKKGENKTIDDLFPNCVKFTFKVAEHAAAKIHQPLETLFKSPDVLMSSPNDKVLMARFSNGLVGSIFGAYCNHHHIVLRPEDFWVAVLTQFSLYVNANSEKLRDTFVDFEGKKKLVVSMPGSLRSAPYDAMAVTMTDEIAKNLKDASVRKWILPSFTTTTPTDTVTCSVVMMATLQAYFEYECCLMCGIPSVTLLGTPKDYKDLARRVDRLLEFDAGTGLMNKWHELLKPIFSELVSASEGNPNVDFWSRVCSHHAGGSGPSYLSGWITAFCRFKTDGSWIWNEEFPKIETSDIPSGMVKVPVIVNDNGTNYETEMLAGSFAANLVNYPKAISPRLDWCIKVIPAKEAEPAQVDPAKPLKRKRKQQDTTETKRVSKKRSRK